ncbi:hypothetical protein pdam_00014649 [Pocillopora damicornis]|uniref:Uncharacterized protein n=1 Tax=Pocillopora damicornis TaxID=46731 RepID=A0A3M6TLQ4_POCDA|nr:hypothetical protein pdam_00014649 [Pocillopora damicornis]
MSCLSEWKRLGIGLASRLALRLASSCFSSTPIVGLPEIKATSFKPQELNFFIQYINIANRTPTRNVTPGSRLVVCKFTRRISEEKVMNICSAREPTFKLSTLNFAT